VFYRPSHLTYQYLRNELCVILTSVLFIKLIIALHYAHTPTTASEYCHPGNTFTSFSSWWFIRNQAHKKFSIGACDWSIGKSSNIEVCDVAKKIGLDGIMVNMGSEKNNLHLRDKNLQQAYLEASRNTGVKISSLAIGELNNVPFKSDPRTEQWVWDSVDVANSLNVPVVLLAFFHKNDLRNDDQGKKRQYED